ncbi:MULTISPECIES: DNA helicase IV [unclassified Vibrio]|uniref:DNA helicase IV n=1 Tax=unclassified Vibrio TaxID=2614977 RepID=UPI0014822A6C|nr:MULTISPECIES: DNA helicase IV [unclassified Vibrio]NNN45030.1 DNA helicase IV [Vibrio sp. 1-1(7)]NNN72403.1 DNA helicase IV [Vibrio sp. 12-2(3-a)]
MQLGASKTAQFFIANEYHQISLENERLVLTSLQSEERIPFTVWNGQVKVRRGLLWAELQFFAHPEQAIQRSWLVQGLPWPQARQFAHQLVTAYQAWFNRQCVALSSHLPVWQQRLHERVDSATFLSHSHIEQWVNQVFADLSDMGMSLAEACHHLPEAMAPLTPWLLETNQVLLARNQQWLEAERHRWHVLFDQLESSPLNTSQQQAVLLNDDHNLVLAGAGSGKTSVLTARTAYLLQSQLAQAEEMLLIAFGKDAANEMAQRVKNTLGSVADHLRVNTFHQLGLFIINQVETHEVTISPLALNEKLKKAWCVDWLKRHWMTPTHFKRWQKHLAQWPIAYLAGDDELGSHVEDPKLIAWLERQLDLLAQLALSKKAIQQQLVDHPDYARLNSELALCWPCFQAWQQTLKDSNQIDFNIMISRAAEYVRKGKFSVPWKYIMVDEYQDISPQRLELIQALCEQEPIRPNLFAVGDDWQSIYQFAGSDVNLTTEFSARFPHSTIHHLDTTYRFNDQIGAVANRFVQKNPHQLPKTLNSFKKQKQPAVYLSESAQVEKVLDQLNRKTKTPKRVLLLGRNHYHRPEHLSDWQQRYLSLQLEFMTCHASKGKEADYVIILAVNEGQFPARVKSLHLDSALNQPEKAYPYAEERRLFYVAMTRAKEKVWVTYSGNGSCFVQELLADDDYPVIKYK